MGERRRTAKGSFVRVAKRRVDKGKAEARSRKPGKAAYIRQGAVRYAPHGERPVWCGKENSLVACVRCGQYTREAISRIRLSCSIPCRYRRARPSCPHDSVFRNSRCVKMTVSSPKSGISFAIKYEVIHIKKSLRGSSA